MNKLKFALHVAAETAGLAIMIALIFALMLVITPPVKAGESEWITGTVGGESINLIRNQITDEWSWTTGTIGDDSVDITENQITDEWNWTTGRIGDDTLNLNRLEINSDDGNSDFDLDLDLD
jgi:hypothetical protein